MSTHECKWYFLLVFVIITCDRKKRLWIGLLITVSPDRIRSGAQPDGYSRLTSYYGLWTMDYKSWHKFHCLNKMLSHEHTGESFNATFQQTPRALWMQGTLKFQRDWSEVPKLWIQKHLFQKWTRQNSTQSIGNMPPPPLTFTPTHSSVNAQKPQIWPISAKGSP